MLHRLLCCRCCCRCCCHHAPRCSSQVRVQGNTYSMYVAAAAVGILTGSMNRGVGAAAAARGGTLRVMTPPTGNGTRVSESTITARRGTTGPRWRCCQDPTSFVGLGGRATGEAFAAGSWGIRKGGVQAWNSAGVGAPVEMPSSFGRLTGAGQGSGIRTVDAQTCIRYRTSTPAPGEPPEVRCDGDASWHVLRDAQQASTSNQSHVRPTTDYDMRRATMYMLVCSYMRAREASVAKRDDVNICRCLEMPVSASAALELCVM